MKGRSHRPRSSDSPDDWIDGSWTVDCICGVNFDDGEEMVKCDECGVWVHTRCSRYVKGDDMFACDKCKSKSNKTDTEETEVAQLLVELPTKTISMENSLVSKVPSRRPFKLWTNIPMEERVHVQGIPGGDPFLFGGLPSIFGRELWKCTGYVPKKFNFQYREFPSWDEGSRKEQENGNPVDNGAGVLLSFSKESVLASPVAALVDMRSGEDGFDTDRKTSITEMNKFDCGDTQVVSHVHNGVKKEMSLLHPVVVNTGKRRKEDFGTFKDRSGKKRVRTSEKEVDPKKRSSHSSKSAFTPTSDAKQLEFYEDRGPKIFKDDTRSIKNKNLKDVVVQDRISNYYFAVNTITEEPNKSLATIEDSSEALYPDTTRHSFPTGGVLAEEKTVDHKAPTMVETSSKTDDAVTSVLKNNYPQNASFEEKEGDGLTVDNADDTSVVRSTVGPPIEDLSGSPPELKDNYVSKDVDKNLHPSSAQCEVKMKIEVNDTVVTSLPSCENKVGDVDWLAERISDYQTKKSEVLSGDFNSEKQELEGSVGSMETQEEFLETKDGSDSAKEPSKFETMVCHGRSSTSSSTLNSTSLTHDLKSEDTEIPNSLGKCGVMADCNIHINDESCPSDATRDEVPRKSVRECPKSSLNSNSKGLHSIRDTRNSVSKLASSDSRDSVSCSSSKASLAHQNEANLGSSETNASLHHQKLLQAQNKVSSVPQRSEQLNQTSIHPSSKMNQNHMPSVNPSTRPNSSMLSDEELALLLHQELNSSPRVPRVPRARHAGSLPQLTSTSATSLLMKRTSSVGGKDHCLVSRRKYKDASRDGLCSSRELEDEAKRIEKEKLQSSADQRKLEMAYVDDTSLKEEGLASVVAIDSMTKIVVSPTSAIATSSPSSAHEDQNLSSIRNSPRNISDDDTATAGRPVHRTLPGLINEIMSKGRRMTYEELCNAVLPHWHNLRKHNGERYAYSSHSQAVLDCLRNRNEWARLIDRGPKTNPNRKRRKFDAEESDDNGYGKGRIAKEVEGKNFELQKEEFPKGKRKARKRRCLALQGRAVKDVRRRQKSDSLTDEDVCPFSNSSEESMFSEDEIQGDRIGPAGSTSDDAGCA